MTKLNALTETLVQLETIIGKPYDGVVEYELEQGTAFSSQLKNNKQVAVVQSFLSAGTIFPYHNHEASQEVLVVYQGVVTVISDEGKTELNPGDSLHICKGCGHMLHAKTDVKIIAITIPRDSVAMPWGG